MDEIDLIIIVTKRGKVIKFDSSKIPERNRGGKGVIGIKLDGDDEVVGITSVMED